MELLDITTSTLVALLGIWATVGRGPWLPRFLVAASLLLTPLLIPAYELVIQYTLAMLMITVGIRFYQGRSLWSWRFSLKSLLLGTTVFAVVSAVMVNAPQFELNQWLDFFGIAMAISFITLLWLWNIFSNKSRWLKYRVFFYSVFFLVLGDHALYALSYDYQSIGLGFDWHKWLTYFQTEGWIEWWLEYHWLGGIVASVLLVSFLFLAKWSRWFEAIESAEKPERSLAMLASRTAFLCLLFATMARPSYVFYRLLTPAPIPVVKLPEPNGYDDLIAAGDMLGNDIVDMSGNSDTLSDSQLETEVAKFSDVLIRIELALSRECVDPYPFPPHEKDYVLAWASCFKVYHVLILRLELSQREGASSQYSEDILRMARFSYAVKRGGGTENNISVSFSTFFSRNQLSKLDPADCRFMAQELCKLDMAREPRSIRVARQQIIDQHTDWTKHIQQILYPVWSEEEQYEQGYWELHGLTECRLLIVEIAVNAYLGEIGQLPESLDDLVPHYLPRIPDDPLGVGPIKYLTKNGKYKIYSNGSDRDDDGGVSEDLNTSLGGDMVYEGLPKPSLEQRFTESLHSAWEAFVGFVKQVEAALP